MARMAVAHCRSALPERARPPGNYREIAAMKTAAFTLSANSASRDLLQGVFEVSAWP